MSHTSRKVPLLIAIVALLCARQAVEARPPSSTIRRQAADQRIRARADEYDRSLAALYQQQLNTWSRSFIEERRNAMVHAAESLAAKAMEIRTAKGLDWNEIRSDPDFREIERQQVLNVIDEPTLRRELRAWAIAVEEKTRREMILLFQKLVAEDLGEVFDDELRGQVVKAVEAIPLEMLLAKDISLRKVEAAINAGLPKVPINKDQRESIVKASKVLASLGGIVWAYHLGLPDLFATQAGAVFAEVAGWVATLGVDAFNEMKSGRPDPARLAENFEQALGQWWNEELLWRLRDILSDFRGKNLDTVESLAIRRNQS